MQVGLVELLPDCYVTTRYPIYAQTTHMMTAQGSTTTALPLGALHGDWYILQGLRGPAIVAVLSTECFKVMGHPQSFKREDM